jgi:Tfp pilus assembly protein PilO
VNARSGVWARRAAWLVAAGVFLAANAGFFFWYRGTARDRREALESRRAALEKDVEAKEVEAKKLAGDRKRLSEVRAALDEFYGHRIGPQRETLASVVDEIHTILKKGGVSPAQISYSTAKETQTQGPLVPMNVAFSFKGDYARFKQLLDTFQGSRKWLSVQGVALSRDSDVPGSVQVHVDLVTYFLPDEESPAARTRMAGGTAR